MQPKKSILRPGRDVKTGTRCTTIYRKAKELGIEVGHEGEVGDVGKELTTFEEARYYYKSIMEGLIANGVDVKDAPWLDVMAAQLGTSHGYDFTDGDKLKPYEGGGITVEEHSAVKKGVVLVRAKEIAKRFKEELGLDVGVALHGFSGTPLEVAPSFVGTGIAKVNINTDWQAITWKVLQAYFPELYKRCYDLSHAAAETALKKLKEQPANAKDDTEAANRKSVEKLQALVDMPFERSRNKIIFGKDGAPGLRTLFRGEVGWALEEEIVETLKRTDVRMIIPAEQNKEDMLDILLTCQRCGPNDKNGLTALEAVHKLTKDRTLALMTALGLDDSADRTPPTDKARELRLQEWQVEELTPSGRDRFTTALQVPKGHHPDLKEVLPGQSGSYRYGGNTYSVGRLLVPSNPDRIFTPEELFETGTYNATAQKRVIVESDDMMTYMSADILTSIMNAAQFQYTFGLATGGTTEALRKLMGLGDMIKSLYGVTLDTDKIRKICTLDNYYFNYYLKRNGFTPEEAEKIIEISSYESEQLYMMIRNLMGGDVKPGFFIAPPGATDKSWFESAEEFKMLMAKYFCVERFVQLWQLHGIGTNSHDAFNEVYARLKRDLTGVSLELYGDRKVKNAILGDGDRTDLAKLGLERMPLFRKIPHQFSQMGMMRYDHPSLISFVIQVQNNGHFLTLMRQIIDKRYGAGKVPFKQFHPFFLKYMGDNSLYDVDELISAILINAGTAPEIY